MTHHRQLHEEKMAAISTKPAVPHTSASNATDRTKTAYTEISTSAFLDNETNTNKGSVCLYGDSTIFYMAPLLSEDVGDIACNREIPASSMQHISQGGLIGTVSQPGFCISKSRQTRSRSPRLKQTSANSSNSTLCSFERQTDQDRGDALPDLQKRMQRSTSETRVDSAITFGFDSNIASIQAIVRGHLSRKKLIEALRKECLQLRTACREKDIALRQSTQELGVYAMHIQQLNQEIEALRAQSVGTPNDKAEPHGMRKTASTRHDFPDECTHSKPAENTQQSEMVHEHNLIQGLNALSLMPVEDEVERPTTPPDVQGKIGAHASFQQSLPPQKQHRHQKAGTVAPAHGIGSVSAMASPISALASAAPTLPTPSMPASSISTLHARSSSSIWTSPSIVEAEVALGRPEAPAHDPNLEYFRYIWSSPTSNAYSVNEPNQSSAFSASSAGLIGETYSNAAAIPAMSIGTLPTDPNELQQLFKDLTERIIRANDQSSSLYMQQCIKTGPDDIKAIVFECVLENSVVLMKNRFGNFLAQCCLEHCNPLQIRALGLCMSGHVLQLSYDRFGCHVMQKAVDCVDEETRTILISELLRSIPDTFVHRFACHVWQRVFEARWIGEPPPIMYYIHQALQGSWRAVAGDESGSLVVQCIFEHGSELDKAPIFAEIYDHTVDIARGQWGNWVVQHLLEHGSPSQRSLIIEIVIQHLYQLSADQYASKVVEKSIKVASKRELHVIIETVLLPGPSELGNCPMLISMMNHQYANYVVQNILSNASTAQREACVRLLAPYLHILRASKYGQRVAAMGEKFMRLAPHKYNTTAQQQQQLQPVPPAQISTQFSHQRSSSLHIQTQLQTQSPSTSSSSYLFGPTDLSMQDHSDRFSASSFMLSPYT